MSEKKQFFLPKKKQKKKKEQKIKKEWKFYQQYCYVLDTGNEWFSTMIPLLNLKI